jgi:hypothetical protein
LSQRRFVYSFKGKVEESEQKTDDGFELQTLLAIRDTLTTLTGACEVCQFNKESVCQKHGHVIKEGDPRCPDFARPMKKPSGDDPKAQYQAYVNEVLGVRGQTLQRLTG